EVFLQPLLAPALHAERAPDLATELAHRGASHRREAIQRRSGAHGKRREVEDLIADRHAAARRLGLAAALEYSERQVLQREIGAGLVRRINPAARVGVVRRV